MSQSLSGWGGVFNVQTPWWAKAKEIGRNPFQGGVGFSTGHLLQWPNNPTKSQSLSGWGGVFNKGVIMELRELYVGRNPFQGGVGFSTGFFVQKR